MFYNIDMNNIVDELNKHGYEAYIVGGYVRDYLLSYESKDIDICTNAKIEDIERIFQERGKSYPNYYSYHIKEQDYTYDITSYRKELKYKNNKPCKIVYAKTLKEDLKRRDFTINTLAIDKNGKLIDFDIFKSVIHSRIQMTYKKVNDILDKNIVDELYKPFEKTLRNMKKLSDILRENKRRRGYIDFEIPEVKILVDEKGKPIELAKREQGTGEKLIEDFMIAANETVATYINNMELPFIYRVHGEPSEEKISSFLNFVQTLGYKPVGKVKKSSPQSVQNLLNQLKNAPEYPIFSELLLRSMQKAVYSENNIGHFGLGSTCYTHFTSPIRRYPDTTVHRLLRTYIFEGHIDNYTIDAMNVKMPVIAEHTSEKEVDAIECEREVDDMKMAEYMEEHIGEVYTGRISGVMNFGLFVELDNLVEGLIRIEDLDDDFYIYDEENYRLIGRKHNKQYRMGDKLKVIVKDACKETKTIDLGNTLLPGDRGSFTVTLDSTGSSVDMYATLKIDRKVLPDNLKFYSTSDHKSEIKTYYSFLEVSGTRSETITIYWYWNPFKDDEDDNKYVGKSLSADISVSAVQISEYAMMKNGYDLTTGGTEFWNNTYRPYIRTINFGNDLSNLPSECNEENLCWDVSYSSTQNKKVYGYLVDSGLTTAETDTSTSATTTKALYNLYIVSETKIYAPIDCCEMFSMRIYDDRTTVSNLLSMNFNDNFDTSKVTDMSFMFDGCSSLTSLDLSSFNTSSVTKYSAYSHPANGMFYNCPKLITTINIMNANITDYEYMFYGAATDPNAQITVNYIASLDTIAEGETQSLIDKIIATKSSNSNVVKGKQI